LSMDAWKQRHCKMPAQAFEDELTSDQEP
jgi:hypothetical protein